LCSQPLSDTSIHADPYRYTTNDSEAAPTINPTTAGELPITPELKNAFLSSLQSLNITLRFFSGSWDTFDPLHTAGPGGYDLVLTSETIYRTDSLEPLINLMQAACTGNPPSTLEHLVSSLHVTDTPPTQAKKAEYICLVAAKVLYFGVGGGVSDFLQAVEGRKARVDTVLERKAGVGRKIMRVLWP
jgi:protein-histidine N-methyltransferase